MAAFWNLVFPYKISFENTEENQQIFDSKYKEDYIFKRIHSYKTVGQGKGNGSEIVYEHNENEYFLDPDIIRKEFKPLFNNIIEEYLICYGTKPIVEIESVVFNDKIRLKFLNEFNNIELDIIDEDFIRKVRAIKNNSFIFFDNLFSMMVFEGYTLPNDFSISVVSVLSSYREMNYVPQETLAIHKFTNYFIGKYNDKYRIAKYLFKAGY
jgi:hypothetical protein